MGSFSGICHLTGLPITEGEEVALVVIGYSSVKDPIGLVYVTEDHCTPISLPIFGEYDGYGCIETDKSVNQVAANSILSVVNSGLLSAKKIQDQISDPSKRPYISNRFAVFKREGFEHDQQCLEFLSDSDIIKLGKDIQDGDFSKLFPKEKFETIEDLLRTINNRSLCKITHDVERFGYILIKKTALDKIQNGILSGYTPEVEALMREGFDFFDADFSDDNIRFEVYDKLSPETIKSQYLNTYNACVSPFRAISRALQQLMISVSKEKEKYTRDSFVERIESVIKPLALMGLIINYYDYTNKTFYPRSCTNYRFKVMMELNGIIEDEINAIKKAREE